ncbi:MAG: preprotein translocase subunit SecG [Eubacteriaceae bacterium]|jgi:preprotein translocase subunit SecG|nr:preprotein translocase subunit SecG [Eubacteriaceae bacterium]
MKIMMIILAVISVIIVGVILMQESNSAGLSGSIAGGAEQLFGKKKSQGYDAILHKVTIVCAVAYIILSLAIVTLEGVQ